MTIVAWLNSTAAVTDTEAVCACSHELREHELAQRPDGRLEIPCRADGCRCGEYRDRRVLA